MASTKETLDIPAPRPWSIDGQTIRDREGVVVMSALNPASMATRRLIVEAVNERDRLRDELDKLNDVAVNLQRSRDAALADADRLRDIVRRLCDELESHYYEPESMDDPCIIREAREAIGEDAP